MGSSLITLKNVFLEKKDIIKIDKNFIYTKNETYELFPDIIKSNDDIEKINELLIKCSGVYLPMLPIKNNDITKGDVSFRDITKGDVSVRDIVMELNFCVDEGLISYASKFVAITSGPPSVAKSDLKEIEIFFENEKNKN